MSPLPLVLSLPVLAVVTLVAFRFFLSTCQRAVP